MSELVNSELENLKLDDKVTLDEGSSSGVSSCNDNGTSSLSDTDLPSSADAHLEEKSSCNGDGDEADAGRKDPFDNYPNFKGRSARDIRESGGQMHGNVKGVTNEFYYPMCHPVRGHCIIFNHKNFDSHLNMNIRNGTDRDRDEIVKCFSKMKFKVSVFDDLTYRQIKDNLDVLADEEDHSSYDCLVVFFLSHGDDGILYAKDCNFPQDKLFKAFEGKRCPSLAGKPKLFFIQACRGGKLDSAIPVVISTETDAPGSQLRVPETADVVIMWSTVPGYYSWRNTTNGSWFIQSLLHCLKEKYLYMDLVSLHSYINRFMITSFQSNVPTDRRMHNMKQCSSVFSTCMRLVHFNPPSFNPKA